MDINQAIKYFGGLTKTAAALSVTEMTIRNWIKAGSIPTMAQLAIEALTKGAIKADKLQFKNKGTP